MNENTVVIYQSKDGEVELRADIEKDTIWATQDQIARLFEGSKQTISRHLLRIFNDGELNEKSVVKEYLTTAADGKKYKLKYFNLDAIIAVGYRVNSKKATLFRIWATGVLREYLKNGHVLQKTKLQESPEALQGISEALKLLKSHKYPSKLKGKITLKITKNLEMKKK